MAPGFGDLAEGMIRPSNIYDERSGGPRGQSYVPV